MYTDKTLNLFIESYQKYVKKCPTQRVPFRLLSLPLHTRNQ